MQNETNKTLVIELQSNQENNCDQIKISTSIEEKLKLGEEVKRNIAEQSTVKDEDKELHIELSSNNNCMSCEVDESENNNLISVSNKPENLEESVEFNELCESSLNSPLDTPNEDKIKNSSEYIGPDDEYDKDKEIKNLLLLQKTFMENQNSINDNLVANFNLSSKQNLNVSEEQKKIIRLQQTHLEYQIRLNNSLVQNAAKLEEIHETEREQQRSILKSHQIQIENQNKVISTLNQNIIKLGDSLNLFAEEQNKLRTEQNQLLKTLASAQRSYSSEIITVQTLLVDAIRELRQQNLQTGEELAHQKARLISYKIRKYDSYKE